MTTGNDPNAPRRDSGRPVHLAESYAQLQQAQTQVTAYLASAREVTRSQVGAVLVKILRLLL